MITKPGIRYFGMSVNKNINDYLNANIVLADTKSSILIAGSLTIIGFLINFKTVNQYQEGLTISSVLMYAISLLFGIAVLIPRYNSTGAGHIFWGDTRRFKKPTQMWDKVKNLSTLNIEEEYCTQNYFMGQILNRKYLFIYLQVLVFVYATILVILGYMFGKML